jgi:hypothetical protein
VGQQYTGLIYYKNNLYVVSPYFAGIKIVDLRTANISIKQIMGSSPVKITIDSTCRLYISNSPGDYILIADTNGTVSGTWGRSGAQNGEFNFPGSIILGKKGRIFIEDRNNGRVQVFSSTGGFVTKLVLAQMPQGATQVSAEKRLKGISFNKEGNLFIADRYFIRRYAINLP